MLELARVRAAELEANVNLLLGDVQNLDFPENAFDEVVATFVFARCRTQFLGLGEIARVLKPNGRLLLLEHVRSDKPILGRLMDLVDPLIVRLMGPHINRRTVEIVRQSQLNLIDTKNMGVGDIFKTIIAQKNTL